MAGRRIENIARSSPSTPSAISATSSPSAGPNLNAWPEQPQATTSGPSTSITKSVSGVIVHGCRWLSITGIAVPAKRRAAQPSSSSCSPRSGGHSGAVSLHGSGPAASNAIL